MPLIGEYEPSTWSATRDQVELFEKSQGAEGKTLLGLPVVIITTTGKGLSAGGTAGRRRQTGLHRTRTRRQGTGDVVGARGHPFGRCPLRPRFAAGSPRTRPVGECPTTRRGCKISVGRHRRAPSTLPHDPDQVAPGPIHVAEMGLIDTVSQ
jgi:hypothetical protein